MGYAAGDSNMFRYCGGDPVNGVDPFGLHHVTGDQKNYNTEDINPGSNYTPDHGPGFLQGPFIFDIPGATGGLAGSSGGPSIGGPAGTLGGAGGPLGGTLGGGGESGLFGPSIGGNGLFGSVDSHGGDIGGGAAGTGPTCNSGRQCRADRASTPYKQ